MSPPKKLFGILSRKERWGLSARGWGILLLILVSFSFLFIRTVHPFLAKTERTKTKILVVEGWVNAYSINAAVAEFQTGKYDRIFTTGGPIEGTGAFLNIYSTSANVGAGRLRAAGIATNLVQMVPSKIADRDRTYSSALALREWFRENNISVTGVNVLTQDTHARRTQLLFQKALGNKTKVGIISVSNPDYDARHWWRYSQGVKAVISEGGAYLYARLVFQPKAASDL